MTFNKSQGGTFDMEGYDATTPVFSHGQNYVALSRVRDFDKLTVLTPQGQTTIKNIVFPQVFDTDYIDTQIRKRTERPILADHLETDGENVSEDHTMSHFDDEMEQYLEHFDHQVHYDPYDGVNEQLNPDAYMYTCDEQAFEEDWIAHDHILH